MRGLRSRPLVSATLALAAAAGAVAYLYYPSLGARGAFAVVMAGLVLVGGALFLLLVAQRRNQALLGLRDELTSSVETVTRDLDAVEQRLKLAMQQYADDTLAGVHANYARLEQSLDGADDPVTDARGMSPAALPDSVDAIVRAQDRIYGQVEGLERVLAVLRDQTPAPPMYGTWAARPDCLSVLLALIEERRPRLIVECGSGVSTLVLAKAVRSNGSGRVIALEHDPDYAAATSALLERHGVTDRVTLHVSDLVDHELNGDEYPWYDLKGLDLSAGIDLLFVDGPPGSTHAQARYPALPLLREHLADDVAVVLDDTRRPDEAQVVERWRQEFDWLAPRDVPTQKGTAVLTTRR